MTRSRLVSTVLLPVIVLATGVGLTVGDVVPAAAGDQPSLEVSGVPVEGGPALIDATSVDAGTFTDDIPTGDVRWFEVEAADGETLTARVTVTTSGVAAGGGIQLTWFDENAREVAVEGRRTSGRGQAATVAVTTGEIDGGRTTGGAVLDAGPYYLAVEVVDFPPDRSTPYVLELAREARAADDPPTATSGPAPGADEPAPGDAPVPEATVSTPASAPSPARSPEPAETDRTGLWLLLASVATAGAAAALWLRHRARNRAEPPAYQ